MPAPVAELGPPAVDGLRVGVEPILGGSGDVYSLALGVEEDASEEASTSMSNGLGAVRPIEATSVPDRVTTELRRSILSGDLGPGQTFSLRDIAGQLGVSFIPVREALRNLEAEGLVVMHPGRSAMVAPLDLEDLQAIYRLRGTTRSTSPSSHRPRPPGTCGS